MDRRTFIGSMAAAGCLGVLKSADASPIFKLSDSIPDKVRKNGFDDDLVVFISDLHTNPTGYQPGRLKGIVEDILKMKPLPGNVIALGDLAYLTGQDSEYAALKPILDPIEAAGITLTLGMGNHDRREEFARTFPDQAAKSQLGHRNTYIVKTPKADFIVMDSLQQGEDRRTWITPGAIDDEQRAWLEQTLASYDKPVFVCSHHPISETKLNKILLDCPHCCGYIYGHDHRWQPDWIKKNYSDQRMIPLLCLPSTGHWGDIGHVCLHLKEDRAVAELHQKEFFFPVPVENPADIPLLWKVKTQDNQNARCTFIY